MNHELIPHGSQAFGDLADCHCPTCETKRKAVQRLVDSFSSIPSSWIAGLADRDGLELALPMWNTLFVVNHGPDKRNIERLLRGHDPDRDPADDVEFAETGWSKVGETGIQAIEFRDELLLGIDGAGYSFFEEHWEPLYDALGYRWHQPSANDRLAAVAPRLLDACELALEELEAWKKACGPLGEGDNTDTVIEELKAAIRAAAEAGPNE